MSFRRYEFCKKITIGVIIVMLLLLNISQGFAHIYKIPDKLWQAIIAEDTSGDFITTLHIASCVRNRLERGMSHGLVAMKRKNLTTFVRKECNYVLKTKHISLEYQAKRALYEVFTLNKDYCNGATYYEHTGKYPIPLYTYKMRVIKILYKNTKKEITFWREK